MIYHAEGTQIENQRIIRELDTFNWEEVARQIERGNKSFKLVSMSFYLGTNFDYVILWIDMEKQEIHMRIVEPVESYDQRDFVKNL